MEDDKQTFLVLLWCIVGLVVSVSTCPQKCQCNLDYFVYCKGMSITDDQLPMIIQNLPAEIRLLDLGSNNIVNITSDLFQRLPNLEYLNLSDNWITTIEDRAFAQQTLLRDLSLQRNFVTSLSSETFVGLSSVKVLNIAANNINSIEKKTFSDLGLLQQLYLTENKMENTTSHMFEGLEDLRLLDISRNEISAMEAESFTHLKSLWELRLNGNKLKVVNSNTFDNFRSVRVLDLSDNDLSDISFFAYCQFRETIDIINLSHNSLTHIPASVISTIRRLSELDLSNNQITSIAPSAFFGLSLLKLNLSGNELSVIDRKMFLQVRKIKDFDLSHNVISEIKTGAFDSFRETLYYLSVTHNLLTEVNTGMLRGMKNLLTLNLENNSINNIYDNSFEQHQKLEVLRISHNSLKTVSENMLRGPQLRTVVLIGNTLKKFTGFRFETQKSNINIFMNMTAQEKNETSVRVTWPYTEGSQIYWRVSVICIKGKNCSDKHRHEDYLPPYKSEVVLNSLIPNSKYHVCVYPVFLNKKIHLEQCVLVITQPSRALTTILVNDTVSLPFSGNGSSVPETLNYILLLVSMLLCMRNL